MFGAGGVVWAAGWEAMMGGIEAADPATARLLEGEDARHTSSPTRAGAGGGGDAMPWRGMLRNTPVRALAYTHFCNNWCALLPGARRVPRACSSRGVRLRCGPCDATQLDWLVLRTAGSGRSDQSACASRQEGRVYLSVVHIQRGCPERRMGARVMLCVVVMPGAP